MVWAVSVKKVKGLAAEKVQEGNRDEKESSCRICNPIKIVGNIQPGLTRTVKSWIIVSKTANRLQEERDSQVWISSHVSESAANGRYFRMRGFNRYAESKFGRKYVHGTVERISGSVGV